MYIGRDFKRDIELDNLKIYASNLRPNRSWIDLFSLSLSNDFRYKIFDFTILTENLNADEVIIINSHDDIFKEYQIQFWKKDRISDILPAIKCPSFKSETKIFKTSEMKEIREFTNDLNHTKSIVIENTNEGLSIDIVYGDTIKITPRRFNFKFLHTNFFNKLKERYSLWEIDDCACKPKKIRVWKGDFDQFQHTTEELEKISIIEDAKLGMFIYFVNYCRFSSNYVTMVFNHSFKRKRDRNTNFIFTGETFSVVSEGNYYNFRLDQRTKESKDSYIRGKI